MDIDSKLIVKGHNLNDCAPFYCLKNLYKEVFLQKRIKI